MSYSIRKYQMEDYAKVVEILTESFRQKYTRMFNFESDELYSFIMDIELVPKKQADGFFVAEMNGEIVGAIILNWNSLKLDSPIDLLKLRKKYGRRKIYRAILVAITLREKLEDDECYIESIAVLKEARDLGIGTALIKKAEEFALSKHFNRLTLYADNNIDAENIFTKNGFRTRKIIKKSILKLLIDEQSLKYMVKIPGISPDKLTIGMFTDTYMPQINGVATSIHSLTKELEEMGHKVYIITIKDHGIRSEFNGQILRIPGVKALKGTDYKLANVLISDRVNNIIKSMNLDIIHSHTEFTIGLLGTYIAKRDMIPQVHTYHTMYDDYIHYATHFEPFQKIAIQFVKIYIREFTDVCKKIIVPTNKTKEVLENYKVETPMSIVPTGIDFSKFVVEDGHERVLELKSELGLTEDDFICMNIGRLSKEKNVAAIIENVKELIPSYPNLKFIVIGDGPEYDKLIKSCKGFENNIMFLGRVPWDQIGYYYKLGNAFVVASRFETQGLTVIEALSSSLPVICPNDEAFMSIVENNYNGFIFEQDHEIKDCIIKLMDETIYNEVLMNTADSVIKYSSEYFAETILKEYKELLI